MMLRELVKPLVPAQTDFCMRLYGLLHALETDPDVEQRAFPVDEFDVFIINQWVSAADGDEAVDILRQSRAALYELVQGEESEALASTAEMEELFDVEVRQNPGETEDTGTEAPLEV